MKKAVIYTRVSSDRQVDNMSLGQQLKACEAYCMSNDLTVEEVFTDEGESAKTAARPKFQEMLEYCRKNKLNVDAVVVYKLDRFARSVQDHAAVTAILRKMNVALLSASEMISESNTGKLMEHMLASFAEFDNSVRSERSTSGMRARSLEGCWVAGSPVGYINHRNEHNMPTLKFADKKTTTAVVRFFEAFATGAYKQAGAAKLAEEMGVRSSSGKPLCKNSVINMLNNIAYAGIIQTKLTDHKQVQAIHPPLISHDLFLTVQAVLDGRRRKNAPEKRVNKIFPLRRYLKCGICSHPLTASTSKGRNGSYPAYHCTSCTKKTNGATVRISKQQAHDEFETLLSLLQPARWITDAFREIVLRRWNVEFRVVQEHRRKTDKELTMLEDKKNSLVDKYIEERITDDVYQQQQERLMLRRLELEAERESLKATEQNKEAIVDEAIKFVSHANTLWTNSPLEDKQRFQKMVFQQGIFVNPDSSFGTTELSPIFEAITDIENFFIENKITEKSDKSLWCPGVDLNHRP
ncbi:MAG: recombinase family protein [Candidatus Saccharimonas sp.]